MTSYKAYYYSKKNYNKADFNLNYYQEIACEDPHCACIFALNIPGADIEYCQEYACKNPAYAYWFARNTQGANIEYCRKACEHNEYWINEFDKMIIEKVMR